MECEKREGSGGDDSWQSLGERALASLQTVRAYRERALQAAYCGLLPPSPCQLEGGPRNIHCSVQICSTITGMIL